MEPIKTEEKEVRRIALIDADFIPYYVCYNKRDENDVVVEKTFDDCKLLVDSFIETMLKSTKATHFLLAFTVGKCFRYNVNPLYKAQRKHEPIPFLKETKEYLIDKYKGLHNPYYEADDIVVSIKKNIYKNESFIISPDKDILNLEGTHWNPKKNEWVVTTKDKADRYFWGSVIIGDSADNIKGIPKKGEKYVEKIFGEITQSNSLSVLVYLEYLNHFGEKEGIEELYKNYMCLKIDDRVVDVNENIQLIEVKIEEEQLKEIDEKKDKRNGDIL